MDTPAAPDNRAPDSADSNDKDPGYFIPVDNLKEQLVEKISGEKENSTWLILNEKYILHINHIFKNGNIVWESLTRMLKNKLKDIFWWEKVVFTQ